MLFRLAFALVLVIARTASQPAGAAEPQTPSETPYPGITYTLWLDSSLPARIHVVAVDLTSASIDLIATAPTQRGQTPSSFAGQVGAVVAINGDSFSPNGYVPAGLARGNRTTWEGTADDARSGFISFFHDAPRTEVTLSAPPEVVDSVADQTVGVVSGRPLLVQGGAAVTQFDCNDLVAMPCDPAPRTAVAISPDGNTLFLVVVDGWQSGSAGMTSLQLADFLAGDLHADRALMFDGGSASAMFLKDGLKSSPSDGVERPVANHLAVHYGAQPDGTILGVVCDSVAAPCMNNQISAKLTLDDGQTTNYTAGGSNWQFQVAPRYVCVTASKSGYHSNTGCRTVQSTKKIYDSITIYPNSDFVDAGPGGPDDASTGADAGIFNPADAAPGNGAGDAGGGGGPGVGGCGCTAGARGSSTGSAALGGLLVFAFFLLRLRFSRQGPR